MLALMQTFCSCCTFIELSVYHSPRHRSEAGTGRQKRKGLVMSQLSATPIVQIPSFSRCHFPPDHTTSFCSLPAINRGAVSCARRTSPHTGCTARRSRAAEIPPQEASAVPTKHLNSGQYVTAWPSAPSPVRKETCTTSLILTKQEAADACYVI